LEYTSSSQVRQCTLTCAKYGYLKTLSQDPLNTIIGIVRTLAPTQEKIKNDGLQNVHLVHGDLTDHASLDAAAGQVSHITGGTVDHLIVNGAHKPAEAYFMTLPNIVGHETVFLEELNKAMTTNVAGMVFAINSFMPLVLKSEIKKVVAISSASGDIDASMQGHVQDALTYGISKAGMNLLVQRYAVAYKDHGVVFLAMNPGWVYTFTDSLETSKCCPLSHKYSGF
jgi:NAD(P)-dependent dehydrogenase (short-subunit alcohol dehydrogenase family)